MVENEKGRSPLDELFKSDETIRDSELAGALKGLIFLTNGNPPEVHMEDGLSAMPIRSRLVAVGLGLHVLVRKKLVGEEALSRPRDWYASRIQEKPKTVQEKLSILKADGLMERVDSGYRVPHWALAKALRMIRSDEEER